MEKAVLLMDYLNVTQRGDNNFSHKGDKSIDLAGKNSGIDSLRAPFTGTIKKISVDNTVWLESNDVVLYADGTKDYMTIMTIHDNNISDLYVGKVIRQGEVYYSEGSTGYATGNHIHLSVGKGKFTGSGWHKNAYGTYIINNQYEVYKALFILNTMIIKNNGGYNFKITKDLKETTTDTTNNNIYTVVKGDNLTKIAKKFNTSVSEIVQLNNIRNKNLIYVGQKLKIKENITYFKKYTGSSVSIVDALKSINEKYTFEYREKIANKNNINNYVGTSTQNKLILDLLKKGSLIKP